MLIKPYLTHVVLSIGSSQEDALYLVKPHLIARLVSCDQELTRLQGHLTRGRGLNKWIGEYVVSGYIVCCDPSCWKPSSLLVCTLWYLGPGRLASSSRMVFSSSLSSDIWLPFLVTSSRSFNTSWFSFSRLACAKIT